jgi:hypothetical protein
LRVKRRDRVISEFQTAVTQATSFPRVEFLVSAMLHRFGGPARFAALWHQHLTNWIKERPASKSVLMGLRAIAQLAQFVNDRQLQQSADEEEPLVGEADLARTLREAIEDLIQTQPELAIAAAERAGWTVIPPN